MRSRFPSSVALTLAGVAVLLALVAPYGAWRDAALRSAARKELRLKEALVRQHGLRHLFDFDAPGVCEWVTGAQALCPGTVSVPGRHGAARKFDGRDRTFIETPLTWRKLGGTFTLALWVRVDGRNADQDILCSSGEGLRTGLRLEGGRMTFDLPSIPRQSFSYPFDKHREFVHLAIAVDSASGTVEIFENGVSKQAGRIARDFSMPNLNVAIGKPIWYATRHPFAGAVDDLSIWSRPLTAGDIGRLSASRHGTTRTLSRPRAYASWRLSLAVADRCRRLENCQDPLKVAPRLFAGRRATTALPEIHLIMSDKPRRNLIEDHWRSRASGRRTQAAARARPIYVACRGTVLPATICLAGTDTEYPDAQRPGYLLRLEDDGALMGTAALALTPPESGGWLMPITDSRLRASLGLPFVSNGLCRLRINGRIQGIYVFSDDVHAGMLPGDGPTLCTPSARSQAQWRTALHREMRPSREFSASRLMWPVPESGIRDLHAVTQRDFGDLLLHDLCSPLCFDEIARALRSDCRRVSAYWPSAPGESPAARAAAFLDEFMVLGNNVSPFRLVEPLDLERLRLPEVQLSWRSTNPEVLDDRGQVRRPPAGAAPAGANLVATITDGRLSQERTLRFRVMPREVALPTLLLYVNQTVGKTRRVDAVVEVCEAGDDHPTRRLTATQGGRGGLSHRGNSSYWYAKKLLLLKTDTPHRLHGDTNSLYLPTINSFQDPTFVRNRLANEIFDTMTGLRAAPASRAPRVRPAEIFVNGRYLGLFELGTRIDPDILSATPDADQADDDESRWIVYRHETVRPREPGMRVAFPAPRHGLFMAPYLELEKLLSRPAAPGWPEQLMRMVDVKGMADYQLLLNLFQNVNGAPFDFAMHEALVYDRERHIFTHVPWDFDTSAGSGEWQWIANQTMRRCETELPGYGTLLSESWTRLRGGALATDALLSRLNSLAQGMEGYARWDYERWQYVAPQSYGQHLRTLTAALTNSLAHIDARLTNTGN
ncbi:MAG: CotH kinase family protein [Kiritimatiellae bacterium]|nr:CotH kinase family protein [Kiritimatiellia bacterium]